MPSYLSSSFLFSFFLFFLSLSSTDAFLSSSSLSSPNSRIPHLTKVNSRKSYSISSPISSPISTRPHKSRNQNGLQAIPIATLTSSLTSLTTTTSPVKLVGISALCVAFLATFAEKVFFKRWRAYNADANSVGREYDAWTRERVLEYYWGEHIHLGYYDEETRKNGYLKKNFIEAKYDFVDRMLDFSGIRNKKINIATTTTDTNTNTNNEEKKGIEYPPGKVLDVGCGIGGTTRHLAKILGPSSELTGITLSGEQVKRATELAQEQGISNVQFKVMDALKMDYPDNSFDFVWACESGEHMPDKKAYVDEMVRVLKPGGTLVIACWCQRDTETKPFTPAEQRRIDFMCTEWSHPYFISIKQFANNLLTTNVMEDITTDDWYQQTLPSWRHSVWVGIFDPIFWLVRPHVWIKCARDAFTLNVFHNAFKDRLMGYGMIRGVKK